MEFLSNTQLRAGDVAKTELDRAYVESTAFLTRRQTLASLGFNRFDDFDRADGTLTSRATMPTRQTWTIGSTETNSTSLVIRNGILYFDIDGASYVRVGGGDYNRLTAAFSFGAGTGINAGVGLISSKKPVTNVATGADGIATNSVHAVFASDTWSVGIFDGSTNNVFASSALDVAYSPLAVDEIYEAAIELVEVDKLRIHLPDGNFVDATDETLAARIGSTYLLRDWWGQTSLIEHYQPSATFATDRRPAFHAFGVSGINITKQRLEAVGTKKITVSSTAPASPAVGDLWIW